MADITITNPDPSTLDAGPARRRIGGTRKAVLFGALAVAGVVGTGVAVTSTGSDPAPSSPAVTSAPTSPAGYSTAADMAVRRRAEARAAWEEACTRGRNADAAERCAAGGPALRPGRPGWRAGSDR